jgi:tetratricopeptide (TPR) repeat protein
MGKKVIFSILTILVSLWPSSFLLGEVIILKNGKEVTGKITSQTDETIKVDIGGFYITYYLDEVRSIDGKKIVLPAKTKKKDIAKDKVDVPKGVKKAFAEKATGYIEKGKKYLNQARYVEAGYEFAKAAKLDPGRPAIYVGLGTAYVFSAKFDEGRKAFKKARAIYQAQGNKKKVREINAAILNIPHKFE